MASIRNIEKRLRELLILGALSLSSLTGCHTIPYTAGGCIGGARTLYRKAQEQGPVVAVFAGIGGAIGGAPIGALKGFFYDITFPATGELHTDDMLYVFGKPELTKRNNYVERGIGVEQEEDQGRHDPRIIAPEINYKENPKYSDK